MRIIALIAIIIIAGCAYPIRHGGQKGFDKQSWQGRLAVRVNAVAQGSVRQSFSSAFFVQGNPTQGQLVFFTPMGTTLATLDWNDRLASLHAPGITRHYNTLQELMISVMGVDVPLPALFAWLQGTSIPTNEWRVDLSQYANGKILAHRTSTEPTVELCIVLEREASDGLIGSQTP